MPSNFKSSGIELDDLFIQRQYTILDNYGAIPGSLWTWGHNDQGQLGDAVTPSSGKRSSPVQIGALTNWKQVSCSYSSDTSVAAIKSDGTLWTWGENVFGYYQLGLGTSSPHRSSPVQVGALTNWKFVASGNYHKIAIQKNGTIWGWGSSTYGQVGVGVLSNSVSVPSQIDATNFSTWKQVTAGSNFSAAIKTDGTLWSWGHNSFGQLGLGNTFANYSIPYQIGSNAISNWKQVSGGYTHMLAVKTDGTLWSWGDNSNGQLGLDNITHRSSPVQVGALTNWKSVTAGTYSTLAIKTDGTLWSWGRGLDGALGHGDQVHRSSPTQVGALTNWKQVDSKGSTSAAVKTDGTLWIWGVNSSGELGQSDITSRSSPVQVGALTHWKEVNVGNFMAAAIASIY